MENMNNEVINNETTELITEVKTGFDAMALGGKLLLMAGGALAWEGGKFLVRKIKAKRAARKAKKPPKKNDEEDLEDMDLGPIQELKED